MIQPFLIALQFLTRLPVRLKSQPNEHDMGRSLLYYPLVGLLIGALLVASSWLLSDTPPFVAAALLVTLWVILTGGLHLDGLADSADAWIGGMDDRDKTLTIMKDPNCGPFGVIAILLVLQLKLATLHALFMNDASIVLFIAVILGRTLLPLLLLTTPYVRSHGLGSALARHQPRSLSIIVIITTIISILFIYPASSLALIMTAAIVFLFVRASMLHRIGGTTGDTAGALVEITEVAVLLAAVLI